MSSWSWNRASKEGFEPASRWLKKGKRAGDGACRRKRQRLDYYSEQHDPSVWVSPRRRFLWLLTWLSHDISIALATPQREGGAFWFGRIEYCGVLRRILFEVETETFEVETETEKYTAPRMTMAIGTVKFFNTTRGFGFIAPDDGGKDVFVHVSALERAGIPAVTEGQKLEFEVTAGRDGRTSAENLKLVE